MPNGLVDQSALQTVTEAAMAKAKRKSKGTGKDLLREVHIVRPEENDDFWEIKLEFEDGIRVEWESSKISSREDALIQIKTRLAALFT